MDAAEISAVVLAVLTTVSGWWAQRERRRRKSAEEQRTHGAAQSRRLFNALRGQSQVYGTLGRLREDIGADRLLLLAAHNGGDQIEQVGTRLYISILAEVGGPGTPAVLQEWNARRVTRDYLGFLITLRRRKIFRLTVDELSRDEHEHIREVYERDGLACSLVIEVGTTRGKYWYLSASYRDPREFTDGDPEEMIEACSDLLDILQQDVLSSFVSIDNGEP